MPTRELQQLLGLWKSTLAGALTTVLLAGEDGLGKTRLATQFATEAHQGGSIVLYGTCKGEQAPCQAFTAALAPYLNICTAHQFQRAAGPGSGKLYDLAKAFDRRLESRLSNNSLPVRGELAAEQELLFEAFVGVAADAASVTPVLLIIDDLEKVPSSTYDLLHHFVGTSRRFPLMLLILWNPNTVDAERRPPHVAGPLHRSGHLTQIDLGGMSSDQMLSWMEDRGYSRLDARVEVLAGALSDVAGGNPLYIREILRSLEDEGKLSQGRVTVPIGRAELLEWLPRSVQLMILDRFDRLSRASIEVLRFASILGENFSASLLRSIAIGGDPDVFACLDQAVDAGFLGQRSDTAGQYMFRHAMYHEIIRASIGDGKDAIYLEAIEAAFSSGSAQILGELGRELRPDGDSRAELSPQAKLGLARAAIGQLAFKDAHRLVIEGMDSLTILSPEASARLRAELLVVKAEASLGLRDLNGFRGAAIEVGLWARSVDDYKQLARAAELLTTWGVVIGRRDAEVVEICKAAVAAIPSSDEAAMSRALAGLAYIRGLSEGEYAEASARAEDAVTLARKAGRKEYLAYALIIRCAVLQASEQVEMELSLVEEALELAEELNHTRLLVEGYSIRLRARLEAGDIAGAATDLAKLKTLHSERRSWFAAANVAMYEGLLASLNGEFAIVSSSARRVREHGPNDTNYANIAAGQEVFCLRELGNLDGLLPIVSSAAASNEGLVVFRAAEAVLFAETGFREEAARIVDKLSRDGFMAIPRDPTWAGCLCLLAEACVLLGDAQRSRALYRLLLPYRGHLSLVSSAVCLGAVDRYLGILSAVAGESYDAEVHLRAAIELETRVRSGPALARTLLWYARVLPKGGAYGEMWPKALLGGSIGIALQFGMKGVAENAKTWLAHRESL